MSEAAPPWWGRFFPLGEWSQVSPQAVQAALCQGFERWGLPQRLRVDNGTPWGSRGELPPALALWLIGYGVEVVWNPPRRPQSNGHVERCNGVLACWTEPAKAADASQLQAWMEEAMRIQRERYPAVSGLSRLTAYPELQTVARPFDPADWQLERVTAFLAQGTWYRRVGKSGSISIYNWSYSVGAALRRQEVAIRFAPDTLAWSVSSLDGSLIKVCPAHHFSSEQIRALDITRIKPKGLNSLSP